jgi:putative oxidoreductase
LPDYLFQVSKSGVMFDLESERIPNRVDLLTAWLPRIAVAVAFVAIGSSKFRDPMWVRLFDRIGFGQWFRYLTGAMQIAGGLLTLVPTASLLGVAMVAATMAGAVVTWIAFGQPFAAIIPGTILIVLVAVGLGEYNRSRT